MIDDVFYMSTANLWVFYLIIGCIVCVGAGLGVKIDKGENWKFIACMITAAILLAIAIVIVLFHIF